MSLSKKQKYALRVFLRGNNKWRSMDEIWTTQYIIDELEADGWLERRSMNDRGLRSRIQWRIVPAKLKETKEVSAR